jgi:4-aminobutyrate--pyruvate transaminase
VRFIADEVICGFGRTSKLVWHADFRDETTSISMAKAITSAYFPMSAITIEEDLYQAMVDESKKIGTFGHGFTYTAHPVGVLWPEDHRNLPARQDRRACGKVAPVFKARLRQAGGTSAGWRSARLA